jgi:hypothetical protein
MFERFRRSRDTEAGAVAVSDQQRERPAQETSRAEGARSEVAPPARREGTEGSGRFQRAEPRDAATTDDRANGSGTATDEQRVERDAPAPARRTADEPMRKAPVMGTDAMDTMRARQKERFGGIKWGSAFFGWLCAIGLAAVLLAILAGAGVALGLSTSDVGNADTAETIGIGGGIALLLVLAIAWGCGGYVAGRMARFDGARQGIGVWIWTLLGALVIAGLAAIGGSEYDVFERLNLPRIAVGDSTLTTGGVITGVIALVVTLVAAIVGGKIGERFHKKIDRVATDEYVGP